MRRHRQQLEQGERFVASCRVHPSVGDRGIAAAFSSLQRLELVVTDRRLLAVGQRGELHSSVDRSRLARAEHRRDGRVDAVVLHFADGSAIGFRSSGWRSVAAFVHAANGGFSPTAAVAS